MHVYFDKYVVGYNECGIEQTNYWITKFKFIESILKENLFAESVEIWIYWIIIFLLEFKLENNICFHL